MAVTQRHYEEAGHPATSYRVEWYERFTPAQAVAFAGGMFFLVVGIIGLARAGLASLTEPTVTVAGLGMTPLLSIAHIVLGAIVLAGAAGPAMSRGTLTTSGAVLIAAGIIALVEPIDSLGWTDANGIAYLIVAGVFMLAAMLTPIRERVIAV